MCSSGFHSNTQKIGEALSVVFQRLPMHEQEILARSLQAPLKLMPDIAAGRRYDAPRFAKCVFEGRFLTGSYIQHRDF